MTTREKESLSDVRDELSRVTADRDRLRAALARVVELLNENDVPTTDGIGEFTVAGRVQAYINNMAEDRDRLRAVLAQVRDLLRNRGAVLDSLAMLSAALSDTGRPSEGT